MKEASVPRNRSGAMPAIVPPFLKAPKYSSASDPKSCHQTSSHGGKTKIQFHIKRDSDWSQQEVKLSKLSKVTLSSDFDMDDIQHLPFMPNHR
jgi:hypothetical protein